jgi:hypothetical protein
MNNKRVVLDVFVISGFVASFFNGLLNPLYISLILAQLDPSILAVGSFLASGLPVMVGAAMGNRRLFRRLYAALPVVMCAELVLAATAVVLAAVDIRAYYLASMFILGLLSSSVIYLLQKVKESRYRAGRAAFDRRVDMADGLGLLAGSGLAVAGVSIFRTAASVAALGALQTAVVYGLFLLLRRTLPAIPRSRGARDDKEPHPWVPVTAWAPAA